MSSPDLGLPADIEALANARFEELHAKGRILYEPTVPEYLKHEGFHFEFRICPFIKSKPIQGPDDDARDKAKGPFVNPKSDEVLCILHNSTGWTHRVMLNKFCMFKPMLLITTYDFELQSDPLNKSDVVALFTTMNSMKTPQLAFYNCGAHSGSSQGHKHMQLFPKPDETKFPLFPSRAHPGHSPHTHYIQTDIEHVPFMHFVKRFPKDADINDVYAAYKHCLDQCLEALIEAGQGTDHNVIMTTEWVALIPRAVQKNDGPWGANAMGMIGMIAVRDASEREQWAKLGYSDYLRQLGLPLKMFPTAEQRWRWHNAVRQEGQKWTYAGVRSEK
ncbi:hypothetical protein EJ05DRAFT_283272 [Pseudovirgaria hyperparasitica]|uniref:Uncharacterized protein n=1 Tax=Pseudovirgaria hyperparasitica TaxID=470096 RepID=A0A6A6WDZ2_9PEZI|nr:uncharacterized protein EJ05DRAFT_283272 [Pseudovirgaria hyperparasitica]KAF2760399.1 hypothetical protein EJ05DRAFT_283272 [Pseudovirgaria hyperparasitica]